jgi:hypothetical protein
LYAYPNPATDDAQAWLELSEAGQYRVVLSDALGRELGVVLNGALSAGKHRMVLPFSTLPSGAYVLRASDATGRSQSLRLVRCE